MYMGVHARYIFFILFLPKTACQKQPLLVCRLLTSCTYMSPYYVHKSAEKKVGLERVKWHFLWQTICVQFDNSNTSAIWYSWMPSRSKKLFSLFLSRRPVLLATYVGDIVMFYKFVFFGRSSTVGWIIFFCSASPSLWKPNNLNLTRTRPWKWCLLR